MSDAETDLDGSSRAAILLMTLGEEAAAQVLKYIDQQEVEQIGLAMAEIGSVSQEQVDSVVETFAEEVEGHTALGIGSEDYLRTILTTALGAESAEGLLDRILAGRNTNGLEALKWMEPVLVADMSVGNEQLGMIERCALCAHALIRERFKEDNDIVDFFIR